MAESPARRLAREGNPEGIAANKAASSSSSDAGGGSGDSPSSSSSSGRGRAAADYTRSSASQASAGVGAGLAVSKIQARKMVLVSSFALLAIAVYRDHKNGAGDTFRAMWGVGIVAIMLSLLADFAPAVAGPFAVLVVLGSLTNGGEAAIAKILGSVAPQPQTKTTTKGSTP